MNTRYDVDVRIEAVPGGAHESTCSCTCGWSLITREGSSQMATRVSDRARTNHFEDVHPGQRSQAGVPTATTPPAHEAALSSSTREGFGWSRTVVCACGWELTVAARTPLESAALARRRHRRHVSSRIETSARPDHLTAWGAVVLALAVLLACAAYVIPHLA